MRKNGCEQPGKLRSKPSKCTPEQIKECHGEGKGHPCESSYEQPEAKTNSHKIQGGTDQRRSMQQERSSGGLMSKDSPGRPESLPVELG
ncbi:MAG: hypothetical protein GX210_08175 [Firmicutes bacterium]|nr:hypothetical protein [Bacillota bacterium]